MIAYTTLGSTGETASPIRPMSTVGSPPLIRRQVLPPSELLWIPEPGPPSIRVHTRRDRWYDAAYMTFGSRGSSATSVTPVQSSMARIRSQVLPPSLDW